MSQLPVIQLDFRGNFIKRYDNAMSAASAIGIPRGRIYAVIGTKLLAGGYKFEYDFNSPESTPTKAYQYSEKERAYFLELMKGRDKVMWAAIYRFDYFRENLDDAKDCFQESYLNIWLEFYRWKPEKISFIPWVWSVTKFTAIHFFEAKNKVRIDSFEDKNLADIFHTEQDNTHNVREENLEDLERAIASLGNNDQEVLRLHFLHTPDHAAEILNITTENFLGKVHSIRFAINRKSDLFFRHLKKRKYEKNGSAKSMANLVKRHRKVDQLNLDGSPVKIWPTIAEITRHGYNNAQLWRALTGKQKQYKGYIWRYSNSA